MCNPLYLWGSPCSRLAAVSVLAFPKGGRHCALDLRTLQLREVERCLGQLGVSLLLFQDGHASLPFLPSTSFLPHEMTMIFQKLFGGTSENNKQQQKINAPQARRLRIESLESRELLAVSAAEFDSIRTLYPDLNLSANMGSYNVIEITAAELSDSALRNAINTAASTLRDDLIVLRTTALQNKITLGGTELAINIDAAYYGNVTIVSLGEENLTIDANQRSRVFNIDFEATVALAGLTITGGVADAGGGIRSYGILTMAKSTITGNKANGNGYGGGGIYSYSYNRGALTVTESTISGNSAIGSGLTHGGGIFNLGTGTLKLMNSRLVR